MLHRRASVQFLNHQSVFLTSKTKSSIESNHGTHVIRPSNYRDDDRLTHHHGIRIPSLATHTIAILPNDVLVGTASFLRQILPLNVRELHETEAKNKSTIEMQLFGTSANGGPTKDHLAKNLIQQSANRVATNTRSRCYHQNVPFCRFQSSLGVHEQGCRFGGGNESSS